mgnify:CR=1 FL=1
MFYLNEQPVKNQAYTLYIDNYSSGAFSGTTSGSFVSIKISKDGGSFNDATNTAIYLGILGIFSLILTADEMNADTILIRIDASVDNCVQIKTSSGGGSSLTAADVWAYTTRTLTSAYDQAEVDDIVKQIKKFFLIFK